MEKELQETFLTYYSLMIAQELFMASPLSNLANNRSEGIHRIKYKFEHDDKKM